MLRAEHGLMIFGGPGKKHFQCNESTDVNNSFRTHPSVRFILTQVKFIESFIFTFFFFCATRCLLRDVDLFVWKRMVCPKVFKGFSIVSVSAVRSTCRTSDDVESMSENQQFVHPRAVIVWFPRFPRGLTMWLELMILHVCVRLPSCLRRNPDTCRVFSYIYILLHNFLHSISVFLPHIRLLSFNP
jgi:hypothetical protein